ncbi:hypothetical protein [Clostridium sp.]|jgi:hypothetical protein|nr:hypothetical protein [Clostridium sp.]
MPYKEMKTPAKEKDNKPKKPDTIEASDMKKKKRKSEVRVDEQ